MTRNVKMGNSREISRARAQGIGMLSHLGRTADDLRKRVSYDMVDADKLARAIAQVCSQAGTIQFGYTKRGNAFSVRVYIDGDGETFWPETSDALHDLLDKILTYEEGD